jgi:adenosylmethionine-8-amino-7-oxononanoate aminotransferase
LDQIPSLDVSPSNSFRRVIVERWCSYKVVAETVVGATTGALPAPKGYFKAMKSVCRKYGALFILDEVMSGMGRESPGSP